MKGGREREGERERERGGVRETLQQEVNEGGWISVRLTAALSSSRRTGC